MRRADNSSDAHQFATGITLPREWAWVPLVVAVTLGALHPLVEEVYHAVVAEDGPVEWATALVYATLTVAAWTLAHRFLRGRRWLPAACYVLLGAGLLFVAGEEISWGQRVLGFAGPEALVEANIQSEANIHNLLDRYALHGIYIFVGLWGLGLGRVVVRRLRPLRPTYLYAPSAATFWWFVPLTAFYVWHDYVGPAVQALVGDWFEPLALGPARYQEAAELTLSLAFAAFLLDVWRRSRRDALSPAAAAQERGAGEPAGQEVPTR